MGYSVYEEPGHARWAGYGVPAECDWPNCETEINRGMAYMCAGHAWIEVGGEFIAVEEGCGLFFCGRHREDDHDGIPPKPDSIEWMRHMLTDLSWATWRDEHPRRVELMREAVQ
jgi:hypothetical protein